MMQSTKSSSQKMFRRKVEEMMYPKCGFHTYRFWTFRCQSCPSNACPYLDFIGIIVSWCIGAIGSSWKCSDSKGIHSTGIKPNQLLSKTDLANLSDVPNLNQNHLLELKAEEPWMFGFVSVYLQFLRNLMAVKHHPRGVAKVIGRPSQLSKSSSSQP